MKFSNLIFGALFFSSLLNSCKTTIPIPIPKAGSADFTKYVAIGNSLTAGYADGGLYLEGQLNSFPNLLAAQMQLVGGSPFVQPLFQSGQENGSGYLRLDGFNANGTPILSNVSTNLAIRGQDVNAVTKLPQYLYTKFTTEINNYGVPGIRLSDILTPGYGSTKGNPFFERILTDGEAFKTYQQKVLESKPTFFSCWLGNNDALGFATSGGRVPLTPTASFNALYAQFIRAITSNGAKGVVGTIPDVTAIPFLNTVRVADVVAAAQGATLYIQLSSGTVRAATKADLINLTTTGFGKTNAAGQPKGFDPRNPLLNAEVLDSAEVVAAQTAVASYNQTIAQVGSQKGLAIMDINALLKQYSRGVVVNGVALNLSYIRGGIFSLDGVHLTPRGYALVANAYIEAINSQYQSSLSTINVANYRGVKFP